MPTSLWRKNLKLLRKNTAKNQATLALELNTSQQTIGNWENGVGSPDIDQMAEITKIFGVTMDDFLTKDFGNAHLNTNDVGKEDGSKSTPNRTPNRTPNAKNDVKKVDLHGDPGQNGTYPNTTEYWKDKYIALLEKNASEKATDYVEKQNFEAFVTRLLAIQETLLELAAHVPGKTIDEARAELSIRELDMRNRQKTGILSGDSI